MRGRPRQPALLTEHALKLVQAAGLNMTDRAAPRCGTCSVTTRSARQRSVKDEIQNQLRATDDSMKRCGYGETSGSFPG